MKHPFLFPLLLGLILVVALLPRVEAPPAELDALAPEVVLGEPEPAPLNVLAHLDAARADVGVREAGYNRGERVEQYQAAAGIPPGSPWCAAAVSHWLQEGERETGVPIVSPTARGGVATSYIVDRGRLTGTQSIDARDVQFGRAQPSTGDLAVWRLGGGWRGHIGVVDDWDGTCGHVVEGNTSGAAAATADQTRDGDGVYLTRRCVGTNGSLRIVAFTPVRYDA